VRSRHRLQRRGQRRLRASPAERTPITGDRACHHRDGHRPGSDHPSRRGRGERGAAVDGDRRDGSSGHRDRRTDLRFKVVVTGAEEHRKVDTDDATPASTQRQSEQVASGCARFTERIERSGPSVAVAHVESPPPATERVTRSVHPSGASRLRTGRADVCRITPNGSTDRSATLRPAAVHSHLCWPHIRLVRMISTGNTEESGNSPRGPPSRCQQ
jgi:hypothetical protein